MREINKEKNKEKVLKGQKGKSISSNQCKKGCMKKKLVRGERD